MNRMLKNRDPCSLSDRLWRLPRPYRRQFISHGAIFPSSKSVMYGE